ncbi:MAG: archaeosortase/exosortase family protein, partial [Candidatus Rokuibacteriota bacterium]
MDATDARPTASRLSGVGSGALLGLGTAAILAVYAPAVAGMAAEWARFSSLSHGFAIPVIAAYLIWGRRGEIARASVSSSSLGLGPLVLGLAMLVVGSVGGESFLARLS